ncbi:hypothetical protein RF11_15521 [Thelohanellus kitauei]|uniref:Uncharacterized protein n=1 Tax=Thelohanellus kitauei TaxID=669202 RepID=A0A0C2MZS1_THEKT|nr:hypothetical protein RF11_15521 [Thelohanellus kitauei]
MVDYHTDVPKAKLLTTFKLVFFTLNMAANSTLLDKEIIEQEEFPWSEEPEETQDDDITVQGKLFEHNAEVHVSENLEARCDESLRSDLELDTCDRQKKMPQPIFP